MKRISENIASVLILVSISLTVTAQKVGLVLSGGGPRGVTHIGILKALEENNIRIDYIAGTSMGAIIGGLYASGYSPAQIEQMFIDDKLQSWISGTTDTRYGRYFKASDFNASWQILKIAIDPFLRIKLPTNMISPHEMDFRFLEWFAEAGAICNYNFDSLVIPFRCVASDISASKYLTLKEGELDKAVRASMTFPFYFKPIRIDQKLMFDGGMYNNFPVDVMVKDFHPDIVIGCKAASKYGPPRDDDVISQIQSMLMANTEYLLDDQNDVLIEPKLRSVSITDFSNTREFIDSGYAAALAQIQKIKSLIKESSVKNEMAERITEFKKRKPEFAVGNILLKGVTPHQEIYLSRLICKQKLLKILNDSTSSTNDKLEKIKWHYYRIQAENQIESVSTSLIYNKPVGSYDLIFDVKRNNRFEGEVGGLVTSKATNEMFLKVQFSSWGRYLLNLNGNAYFGRFHNSGHIGARLDLPGSIPLAIDFGYTANGWNYFKTSTYFFEDEKPSYLVQQDNYWMFSLSTPVLNSSRIGAEITTGVKTDHYYQTNQFNRLDTTDRTTFDFYSPRLVFEWNTLNRKQYPSEGSFFRLCSRFISGLETNIPGSNSVDTIVVSKYHNWFQITLMYDRYIKAAGRLKPGVYFAATLSNKPFFNNYISTALSAPSFEPIPESQTLFLPQFRASDYAALGVKFVYDIARNFEFRAEGYVFHPYEDILKTEDNKTAYGKPWSNRYYITSGAFVYHTPFGPISMCLNYYDQADVPFSFNINLGYFIFNRRPF